MVPTVHNSEKYLQIIAIQYNQVSSFENNFLANTYCTEHEIYRNSYKLMPQKFIQAVDACACALRSLPKIMVVVVVVVVMACVDGRMPQRLSR